MCMVPLKLDSDWGCNDLVSGRDGIRGSSITFHWLPSHRSPCSSVERRSDTDSIALSILASQYQTIPKTTLIIMHVLHCTVGLMRQHGMWLNLLQNNKLFLGKWKENYLYPLDSTYIATNIYQRILLNRPYIADIVKPSWHLSQVKSERSLA